MGLTPPLCLSPPGSQPQALRRLAAGPTPCEGDVEVFHDGRWHVLCDNSAQRAEWGRQLCRELRCGNLSSSTEIGTPTSMGVTCKGHILHLCHASLGAPRTCSRTRVVCKPPNRARSPGAPWGYGQCCLQHPVPGIPGWKSCSGWELGFLRVNTSGMGRGCELRAGDGEKLAGAPCSPPGRAVGAQAPGISLCLGTRVLSSDTRPLPRPRLEAAARRHGSRHHREHLPGPASLRHPPPPLRPSCLQEADEEK